MLIAEVSGGSDRRRNCSLCMRWANVCFVTGEFMRRKSKMKRNWDAGRSAGWRSSARV